MEEKVCGECGGKAVKITLNAGINDVLSVSVPDGYNFPKQYAVEAYMCEKCGKISFYADLNARKK